MGCKTGARLGAALPTVVSVDPAPPPGYGAFVKYSDGSVWQIAYLSAAPSIGSTFVPFLANNPSQQITPPTSAATSTLQPGTAAWQLAHFVLGGTVPISGSSMTIQGIGNGAPGYTADDGTVLAIGTSLVRPDGAEFTVDSLNHLSTSSMSSPVISPVGTFTSQPDMPAIVSPGMPPQESPSGVAQPMVGSYAYDGAGGAYTVVRLPPGTPSNVFYLFSSGNIQYAMPIGTMLADGSGNYWTVQAGGLEAVASNSGTGAIALTAPAVLPVAGTSFFTEDSLGMGYANWEYAAIALGLWFFFKKK